MTMLGNSSQQSFMRPMSFVLLAGAASLMPSFATASSVAELGKRSHWNLAELPTGSSSQDAKLELVDVRSSNGTLDLGQAPQSPLYAELLQLVSQMAALPEGVDQWLEPLVAGGTQQLIQVFAATGVPAPKIFTHSGDVVVFTWHFPRLDRYATLSNGEIFIVERQRASGISCEHEPLAISEHLQGVVEALGGNSFGASSVRQWT